MLFFFQFFLLQQDFRKQGEELRRMHEELSAHRKTIAEKDSIIAERDTTISQLRDANEKLRQQLIHASQPSTPKRKVTLQGSARALIYEKVGKGKGYNFSEPFTSPSNSKVTEQVQDELVKLNDGVQLYSPGDVQGVCKAYYTNKKDNERRKANGSYDKLIERNRIKNRKRRKWEERKEVLKNRKADLNSDQWEKAEFMVKTIGLDAMSSEEDPCCSSDEEKDRRKLNSRTLNGKRRYVKHRPWISQEAQSYMHALDEGYLQNYASERQKKMRWTLIRDASCPISDTPVPDKVLQNEAAKWMLNSM